MKICLDAGHYGKRNRSPVVPAYYESDMNWALHLKLKRELERYGFEVTTTRSDKNTDLDLVERGKASKGCDLFLSLHSNACDTERVDRPVGIYLVDDAGSTADDRSKEIAKLLANVVRDTMQTTDAAKYYSKLSDSDRDGDGKKDDNYYGVLHGARLVGTPGVILEHSFHTNTRAAKWLLVDSNLQKLAEAEAKALAEHYGVAKNNVLYRVQVGAFHSKAGAEQTLDDLKKAGFNGFIVSEVEAAETFSVGDKVRIAAGAPVYGTSKKFSSWVYDSVLYVRKVAGDKITVSILKEGATTGSVDKKYLTKA